MCMTTYAEAKAEHLKLSSIALHLIPLRKSLSLGLSSLIWLEWLASKLGARNSNSGPHSCTTNACTH